MRTDIVQRLGLGSLNAIRRNPRFPFKTGRLKWNATKLEAYQPNQFTIVFDKTIAPYIKYLDEGTKSGGYFNKQGQASWFSGQTKHVGFISRAKDDVINYLAVEFRQVGRFTVKKGNTRGYGR